MPEIQYEILDYSPPEAVLSRIWELHRTIFGGHDQQDLLAAMAKKTGLLAVIAREDYRIVGYKLGYERKPKHFYSWLGGVDPACRRQGIGRGLMEFQHQWLRENGYQWVRTHTMNRWRDMLILNLLAGFEIIGTYSDHRGGTKIIMEKGLATSLAEPPGRSDPEDAVPA